MRTLAIADTHLGVNYPYSRQDKSGVSDRLNDIYNIFLYEIYGTHYEEWDIGIHAGDFFDEYELSGEVLHIASRIINLIECKGKPFYILKGNHDDDGRLSVLKHYLNFNLRYCHFVTDYNVISFKDTNFYFVPWGPLAEVRKNLNKVVNSISGDGYNIVVGHFAVKGTEYCKTVCREGILRSEIEDLILSGRVDYVMLGHHHKRQHILSISNRTMASIINWIDRAVYVGSSLQKDFGEMYENHGYYIIDPLEESRFFQSNAPQFMEMAHTSVPILSESHCKNNIVKVIFEGSIINNPNYMREIKEMVLDKGARRVIGKIVKPKTTKVFVPISSNLSPEKMIEKYVTEILPPSKKLNKNNVIKFGTDILDEVRKRGAA